MKSRARHFWPFLAAALAALPAAAAVTRLINFQGRVTDTSGVPITVATTVDFRLFNASSGGSQLYLENRAVTPDADGLYSLNIGESASLMGVDFDQDLWLSVTVNGELMPTRFRLTPFPYAVLASSAASVPWTGLTGVPAGFSDNIDDTTPGTGAVGTAQLADGGVQAADLATDSVTSVKILNGEIVNADVSASAAIAYSKLNLSASLVNADVSSSADIAASKINGGAFQNEAYSFPAGAVLGGSTVTAAGDLQMPSGATITIGSVTGTILPSGTIILTVSNCPTGFTEFTSARGLYLVGVPSGGTIAGTVGSAMTNLLDSTHSHTITTSNVTNLTALGGTTAVATVTSPSGTVARSAIAPYIQVRLCTVP